MKTQENKKKHGTHMKRMRFVIIAMLVLSVAGVGCARKRYAYVHMTSYPDSNNGRPVYVMVREVNKSNFLVDYYGDIAELIYADKDKKDESVLGWVMVKPGEKTELKVRRNEGAELAFYGLFTEPGDNWKVWVSAPLKKSYRVYVGKNNLWEAAPEDDATRASAKRP